MQLAAGEIQSIWSGPMYWMLHYIRNFMYIFEKQDFKCKIERKLFAVVSQNYCYDVNTHLCD